ncbi:MAG: hypothetical protein ACRDQ5_16125 [Sciscionella sp.]
MTDAQRIVIDTDPGVDDALALLIALTARELDVRAVPTGPSYSTASWQAPASMA